MNSADADVMDDAVANIRESLNAACAKHKIDLVALSGGLDSSIVAWHATRQKGKTGGIAVIAEDFVSPDLVYCKMASQDLGIPLVILNADTDMILDGIKETVKILKNFNEIEIRNNVVIYLAAKWASDNGYTSLATGDGADELFAGYKFLVNAHEDKLAGEIERVCNTMHFPSHAICKALGISAISPFLDADVIALAKSIDSNLKVRNDVPPSFNDNNFKQRTLGQNYSVAAAEHGSGVHDSVNDNTIRYGKWILRKSFEDLISRRIAWRPKYAMQDGSGTAGLTEMFNSIMRVDEKSYVEKTLEIKMRDGVVIRNMESLHYYEIFRGTYGRPADFDSDDSCHGSKQNDDEKTVHSNNMQRCPYCKFLIPDNVRFCRMCAAFPI